MFQVSISLFHQVLVLLIVGFSAILNISAELHFQDTWRTAALILLGSLGVTDGEFWETGPIVIATGIDGMVDYTKNC